MWLKSMGKFDMSELKEIFSDLQVDPNIDPEL